ncbi:conserved protein, unknown function [Plasmodium knowlesi strain H]|uniref:Pre-mRNA-splicing factor CWF7 n=3 Tax=Plasmodium knowlesi TaxID=5850 RepID=A0A5K1UYC7_PLAKH|nr:pre-mRNA-splicing factor CWF7, putative [Plasmodium knowlesi strain H]OTN64708.1 Uncharacterized protein PKNOH_S130202100 [Plasmodium knowlesi]CAA9989181.1 pre-mRNA-splicing factor CWF7, putative [Plasmodium knowlesi strain H]SBO27402.1 conserved protein, unknown function [Plasmodium knowlesi strain H]SBO27468.1 conserved protein, unknown function [Plasmodium knowlesi strain H]VVS78655.1 pre-mRNA-splicing factor CWF7, putative [Plasmodium knowlesi strain H]|eukprot:XP_002261528.1 hypothetical protein, conserved in Plasmodium species [Plasmodium knowlesi strain H]
MWPPFGNLFVKRHEEQEPSSASPTSSISPHCNGPGKIVETQITQEETEEQNALSELNNEEDQSEREEKEEGGKKKKLYELNELHYLVNALPYIDSHDSELEKNAKQLVEEEMMLMQKQNEIKNYLQNFDIPQSVYVKIKNSVIPNELKRCEQNINMEKLNLNYYNIDKEELNEEKNVNQWANTLTKHKIVLENMHNALINVELMNKYKEVMWSEHMKVFAHIDVNLQNNIKLLKDQIDNINKQRKLHQLSYVKDLSALQNERSEYKRKNDIVLEEIKKLLSENLHLRYRRNEA